MSLFQLTYFLIVVDFLSIMNKDRSLVFSGEGQVNLLFDFFLIVL